MTLEDKKPALLLAFLDLLKQKSIDKYIGAILVVNIDGIPQEFRCTDPIKPSKIQEPLYGNKLEQFIGAELCGIPLVNSLKNIPGIIIVQKKFLLKIREKIDIPLVLIEVADSDNINIKEQSDEKEKIIFESNRFSEIKITTSENFKGDQQSASLIINSFSKIFHPLEPFERIEKAIEVISIDFKNKQNYAN